MSLHSGRVVDRGYSCVVDTRVERGQYHALVQCGRHKKEYEGPTNGAPVSTVALAVVKNFVTRLKGTSLSPTKARRILHDRGSLGSRRPLTRAARGFMGAVASGRARRNSGDEDALELLRAAATDPVATQRFLAWQARNRYSVYPAEGQKLLVRGRIQRVYATGEKVWIEGQKFNNDGSIKILSPTYWRSSLPAYNKALALQRHEGKVIQFKVEYSRTFGWYVYSNQVGVGKSVSKENPRAKKTPITIYTPKGATKCSTCTRAPHDPYQRVIGGKLVEMCVDPIHAPFLTPISASASFYRAFWKKHKLVRPGQRRANHWLVPLAVGVPAGFVAGYMTRRGVARSNAGGKGKVWEVTVQRLGSSAPAKVVGHAETEVEAERIQHQATLKYAKKKGWFTSRARVDRKANPGQGKYVFRNARAGDYAGHGNSAALFKSLRANALRAKTGEEVGHAIDQVRYLAACRTISQDDARSLLNELIPNTRGGYASNPRGSLHVIEIQPNGDPFGGGWTASETTDGGKTWFYRGDAGARSREWWRREARRSGATLRIDERYRNPREVSVSVPTAREAGRATARAARSLARGTSKAARSAWSTGREFVAGLREKNARSDKGTWAYTADGQVFVPEKKIIHLEPGMTIKSLRGYRHSKAVFDREGRCIGWFESLRENPRRGPAMLQRGDRVTSKRHGTIDAARKWHPKFGTVTWTGIGEARVRWDGEKSETREDPKNLVRVDRANNPSKKDYVATAAILAGAPAECRAPLVQAFAKHFQEDNAAFKPALFAKAAGVRGNPARWYHVVAINERTGRRERLTSSPLSHHEAVVMKGKFRPHRDVRIQLEEVRSNGYRANSRDDHSPKGVVDSLGYVYCLDHEDYARGQTKVVRTAPHVDDKCDACGRTLQSVWANKPRKANPSARCAGCGYDVPRTNPGGAPARHLNPRTRTECRGNAGRPAQGHKKRFAAQDALLAHIHSCQTCMDLVRRESGRANAILSEGCPTGRQLGWEYVQVKRNPARKAVKHIAGDFPGSAFCGERITPGETSFWSLGSSGKRRVLAAATCHNCVRAYHRLFEGRDDRQANPKKLSGYDSVRRVPLRGDYDERGRYWGSGPPWLFRGTTSDGYEVYVRAMTRDEALAKFAKGEGSVISELGFHVSLAHERAKSQGNPAVYSGGGKAFSSSKPVVLMGSGKSGRVTVETPHGESVTSTVLGVRDVNPRRQAKGRRAYAERLQRESMALGLPGGPELVKKVGDVACKRCKGVLQVKLGPRMVACPLCQRKGGKK